jgi:Cache 3/Cache 2 fusion domain
MWCLTGRRHRFVGQVEYGFLDPKGKAIAAISKGESYFEEADILGKPYVTGYEPIRDASGERHRHLLRRLFEELVRPWPIAGSQTSIDENHSHKAGRSSPLRRAAGNGIFRSRDQRLKIDSKDR